MFYRGLFTFKDGKLKLLIQFDLMPDFCVMTSKFQMIWFHPAVSASVSSSYFLLHMRRMFDEHTSGN